jgi:hypothetical protein
MRTLKVKIRFSAFFALLLVSTAAIGAQGAKQSASGSPSRESSTGGALNPRDAMITTLAARSASPALGEEAQTFDRLVGVWDADFSFPKDDGTVSHKKGEILFGWVMDGHAIQDLWISYPTPERKERTIGTTFRFFDKASKQWRIVFVNPQFNYMVTAQGGREGDRIILHGVDSDGLPFRWTFSEIKSDSFHWQGEKSHDGGKTWKLEEDHHMKRRS